MKTKVSKYHFTTFYIYSFLAVFAGLGIETFTTIPLNTAGGIGYFVSFVTILGLPIALLKFKSLQQKKAESIILIPVNHKKNF